MSDRAAVLVVDDNAANLTALEAALGPLDLDVIKASSGEDALKQLLVQDFAVVLMDIQMPGLDGFQTTELIRQRDRTRHTPIIFVTAIFTDGHSASRAYSLGALDFITKPFDEAILKAKIHAIVGHYRQAQLIERKAAEEANRAKDEFLAVLSHELRAPLNAILGWASHLQLENDLPPKAARGIEAIERGARAQSKLVDELLEVSQIVADKLRLAQAPLDLATIAEAAVASMRSEALGKQIAIELQVGPGSYASVGDGKRLTQMLGHLLSNALKFSPSGSPVAVALTRDDAGFRISVKDAGEGIEPGFLPHVFERFRQQDATRTRRHGGLGIGLTVARHVVILHGGTIEAFSAGLGRGAELVVRLPFVAEATAAAALIEAAAPPPTLAGAAARPLSGIRVLVADDDADARELFGTVLADAGAQVVITRSAPEALAAFAAGTFDLLVSDLGMPEEGGLALVRKIRAIDRQRGGALVAVAVSGYGSAEDIAESRAAGFAAHVVKPFETSALLTMLARLTRRPA